MGKQPLLPVEKVAAEDGADTVFIHAGVLFQKRGKVTGTIRLAGDFGLEGRRDLGIGDEEGGKEGVGLFTFAADHTENAHTDRTGRCFEGAAVISMDGKAGGAAAGAGKLMEL